MASHSYISNCRIKTKSLIEKNQLLLHGISLTFYIYLYRLL